MTMALGQPLSTPLLARSTPTSITKLSPTLDSPSAKSIDAIVSLLWPYSSSSKTFALLLADPDYRLRRLKGQVKVAFLGPSAKAVASSQVGIGDRVRLCLDGAQWTHLQEDVHTPGKSLDWDITYNGRVQLEVFRNGDLLSRVNLDDQPSLDSPAIRGSQNGFSAHIPQTAYLSAGVSLDTFSSPSFRKFIDNTTTSFLDASLQGRSEGNSYALGPGGKRTRFSRTSGGWRYEDRSPSPVKSPRAEQVESGQHEFDITQEQVSGGLIDRRNGYSRGITSETDVTQPMMTPSFPESDQDERDFTSKTTEEFIKPPLPPARDLQPKTPPRRPIEVSLDEQMSVRTPYLMPLASPGLPLVSPLMKEPGSFNNFFPQNIQKAAEIIHDEQTGAGPDPFVGDGSASSLPPTNHVSEWHPKDIVVQSEASPIDQEVEESCAMETSSLSPSHLSNLPKPQKLSEVQELDSSSDSDVEIISVDDDEVPLDASGTFQAEPSDQTDLNAVRIDQKAPEDEELDMYEVSDEELQSPSRELVETISAHDLTEHAEKELPDEAAEYVEVIKVSNYSTLGSQSPRSEVDALARETSRGEVEKSPSLLPSPKNWDRSTDPEVRRHENSGISQDYQPRSMDGLVDDVILDDNTGADQMTIQQMDNQHAQEPPQSELGGNSDEIHIVSGFMRSDLDGRDKGLTISVEGNEVISGDGGPPTETIADLPASHGITTPTSNADRAPATLGESDMQARPILDSAEVDKIDEASHSQELANTREETATPSASRPQAFVENEVEAWKAIGGQGILTPAATQSFGELPPAVPASRDVDGSHDEDESLRTRRRSPRLTRRDDRASIMSPWFTPAGSSQIQLPSSTSKPPKSPSPEPSLYTTKETKREHEPSQDRKLPESIEERPKSLVFKDAIETATKITSEAEETLHLAYSDWPKGLRTSLGYFPTLSGLNSYFNQTVDIIGLCSSSSTTPKRAPSGPKDYFTTLHISDPALSGLHRPHDYALRKTPAIHATSVQIFRPWRNALPATREGDVVLLRHFKVQSRKREMMLLSTEGSGWAVFPMAQSEGAEEKVSGPPVEYGEEERVYARKLQTWWDETRIFRRPREEEKEEQAGTDIHEQSNPKAAMKRHKRQNSKLSSTSFDSATGKTKDHDPLEHSESQQVSGDLFKAEDKADQGAIYHELKDGTKYADAEEDSGPYSRTRSHKASTVKNIHELRDGTSWKDS